MDHRRSGGDFRCGRDCRRSVVLAIALDRGTEERNRDHYRQNDERCGDQEQRVALHSEIPNVQFC